MPHVQSQTFPPPEILLKEVGFANTRFISRNFREVHLVGEFLKELQGEKTLLTSRNAATIEMLPSIAELRQQTQAAITHLSEPANHHWTSGTLSTPPEKPPPIGLVWDRLHSSATNRIASNAPASSEGEFFRQQEIATLLPRALSDLAAIGMRIVEAADLALETLSCRWRIVPPGPVAPHPTHWWHSSSHVWQPGVDKPRTDVFALTLDASIAGLPYLIGAPLGGNLPALPNLDYMVDRAETLIIRNLQGARGSKLNDLIPLSGAFESAVSPTIRAHAESILQLAHTMVTEESRQAWYDQELTTGRWVTNLLQLQAKESLKICTWSHLPQQMLLSLPSTIRRQAFGIPDEAFHSRTQLVEVLSNLQSEGYGRLTLRMHVKVPKNL